MIWAPQPGPQVAAIDATWCPELFFGGSRGGGKSDFLLGDYAQDIDTYGKNWQGILIRRTYPELQEVIRRSFEIYTILGGTWHEQAKEWRWSNGACLRMRYLENLQDATRYQGHQFTWIGWDEITQWPEPHAYQMLFACLRWAEADVPTKRIRVTGNPGGSGHNWVKERFIDPHRTGYKVIQDAGSSWRRMFIPSRVEDNRILLARDPQYIERLNLVGSKELVRMWLAGDWDVVPGAYFEVAERHIFDPFPIPRHWPIHVGFDWGHASPFCCLWAAVSSGKDDSGKEVRFPKGALLYYREAYGREMDNPAIGKLLRSMQPEWEDPARRVADPSIFTEDGGPSIAEQIRANGAGYLFTDADNTRLAGWSQIRQRLNADPPLMYISTACANLLRTLPALQHDPKKLEDVDTTQEDHAADAARYLAMSRPLSPTEFAKPPPAAMHGRVRVAAYVKQVRKVTNQPRI